MRKITVLHYRVYAFHPANDLSSLLSLFVSLVDQDGNLWTTAAVVEDSMFFSLESLSTEQLFEPQNNLSFFSLLSASARRRVMWA